MVTLDLSRLMTQLSKVSRLGQTGGAVASQFSSQDAAYHAMADGSWLVSSGDDTGQAATRTVSGVVGGLEFDYDFKLELKGGKVIATLVVRKPFPLTASVEIDLTTGQWSDTSGTMSKTTDVSAQTGFGTLGCGKWCIIRCLGFGALKCILCGPAWPCWVACLKTSAPGVAVCIAKCCK